MSRKGRTHRKRVRRKCDTTQFNLRNTSSELLTWMELNGFKFITKLDFSYFAETGRGVVALEKVVAGETFLRIPERLLIYAETALRTSLRRFLTRHHTEVVAIEVLTLFLMNEKLLGETSQWQQFINSLPATFTTPVFLKGSLLKKLPSDIYNSAQKDIARILRTFLKLKALLGHDVVEEPQLQDLYSQFEWKLFIWAWTAVNTRCIFAKGSSAGSLWKDDHCALAPFLDCLNHHWKANVKTAMVGTYFEIVSI